MRCGGANQSYDVLTEAQDRLPNLRARLLLLIRYFRLHLLLQLNDRL